MTRASTAGNTPPSGRTVAVPKQPALKRQVFVISRELEYFSESELVTQTGYPREQWWPGVILKELVDNTLDACEQSGIAPHIKVAFDGRELVVEDNGPGLQADVIEKILDFSSRTSDKAAYVSPTRGAQGNALKTVLAMPYVLGGGLVEIHACGIRHQIRVSTDQVAQRPRIDHQTGEIVQKAGTTVRVVLDSACSKVLDAKPGIVQKILADYGLFNPHGRFELVDYGVSMRTEPTAPGWRKWLPTDPTSPHWYDTERLCGLIGCYISAESDGGRVRTVREFVSEFRGLARTAKQKEVTTAADLERAYLHDLVRNGKFDQKQIGHLLASMRELSAPVKPEALGILGEEHFRRCLLPEGKTFRYARTTATDGRGLPCLVEAAFAIPADKAATEKPEKSYDGCPWNQEPKALRVGLNWSVPLDNPLRNDAFAVDDHEVHGLEALLENQRIDVYSDRVSLAIHIVNPRFQFVDRGKGSVALGGGDLAEKLAAAITKVTKDYAQIRKKEDRERRRDERARERYSKGRGSRTTIKDAAAAAIPDAYQKASGGGKYPANARQVMYAARPRIQEVTGQTLNDAYFTQTLLPNYEKDNPEETANWDVIYDARGHILEPHTSHEIGLGTLEVREYLASFDNVNDTGGIEPPILEVGYPTKGPRNRYNSILYIEKEGFLPLLREAQFAERYDLAIMSSKGMSTTAARTLIEKLSDSTTIYVLHDFDKSGFSILGTMTRDTRRYEYATRPNIVDLGLRLSDVQNWHLQSEDVSYGKSDPQWNLQENGATAKEIAFLCSKKTYGGYAGRRVELNAFTSPQFITWLDKKLVEHGARKVIPDEATLIKAYRRAEAILRFQQIIDAGKKEVTDYAATLTVPRELRRQIAKMVDQDTALPWDKALQALLTSRRDRG